MKTTKKLIAVLLAITLIFVLISCNDAPHVHTFSEDWTYDETNHWHTSTCGHTAEVSDKAAHTFGETKVTKEATEDVEGEQTTTCTSCGYEKKETIAKLVHKHTFSSDWSKDETSHWHAATCGHTDEVSDKADHDFDDGRETKTATETEEGEKTYKCKSCGYEKKETIAKLEHKHTFSSDWSKDETSHWHAATCGHTTEVRDKAVHTFGETTVTKEATEDAEGEQTTTCTSCGYEKKETIAKLEHKHTFSSDWSKDKTSHWHASTCGHTDEVSDKADHDFSNISITKEATCTETGLKSAVCSICKANVDSIETPALGHDWGETKVITESTCTTEGTTQTVCKRDNSHIETGVIEKKAHDFTGTSTTVKEAGCETKGEITTKCKNCDAVTTTYTDPLGHSYTIDKGYKTDENNNPIVSTEFKPGIKIYQCERCDATTEKDYWDEKTSRHVHYGSFQDSSNIYGKNVIATCTVEGKDALFCSCYTNGTDFTLTESEGYTKTFMGDVISKDDEDYESKCYVNIGTAPNNHVDANGETKLKTTKVEVDSYFYKSYTITKCTACEKEVGNKTFSEDGKCSAVGRWVGSVKDVQVEGQNISASMDCDISLYSNGISIFQNYISLVNLNNTEQTIGGDYMVMMASGSEYGLSSFVNLYRTSDGRWLSTEWSTSLYSSKAKKMLNYASDEYSAFSLPIAEENVSEKTMKAEVFSSEEDSLVVLECQKLSEETSVIAISGVSDLTALTFAKNENTDTVTIPAGNDSVTLTLITLKGDGAATYTWQSKSNGSVLSTEKTCIVYASAGDCTVKCTVGTDIHTVKICFAQGE